MTQSPSVYDDLSVRENARYFATLYGLPSDEADRVIGEVGLQKAAAQLVRTLSGGQRARASLACALIGGPRVLVLDEPTVGQDPVLRDELWQRFNALAGQGCHNPGFQSRDGRGRPLPPVAAAQRRPAYR